MSWAQLMVIQRNVKIFILIDFLTDGGVSGETIETKTERRFRPVCDNRNLVIISSLMILEGRTMSMHNIM